MWDLYDFSLMEDLVSNRACSKVMDYLDVKGFLLLRLNVTVKQRY